MNMIIHNILEIEREKIDMSVKDIVTIVARYFGFDLHEITDKGYRARRISHARKAAIYLVKRYGGLTYRQTGALFNTDSKGVQYAWNDLHQTPDPNAARELEDITQLLKAAALAKYDQKIPF